MKGSKTNDRRRPLAFLEVRLDDAQRVVGRPAGPKPCEQFSKSASKIGSSISNTAACTTRSRTVGMPHLSVTRPNRVRGPLRLAHLPPPASASRVTPVRFGFGYMTFDQLS